MSDPYLDFLGIPLGQRPPTHYQLLGIMVGERNEQTIRTAAEHQLMKLAPYRSGTTFIDFQRLSDEVAKARDLLLNPVARTQYDSSLPGAPAPWWTEANGPQAPIDTSVPKAEWWKGQTEPPPSLPGKLTETAKSWINDPNVPPPDPSPVAKAVWWKEPVPPDVTEPSPPLPPPQPPAAPVVEVKPQLPTEATTQAVPPPSPVAPPVEPAPAPANWWQGAAPEEAPLPPPPQPSVEVKPSPDAKPQAAAEAPPTWWVGAAPAPMSMPIPAAPAAPSPAWDVPPVSPPSPPPHAPIFVMPEPPPPHAPIFVMPEPPPPAAPSFAMPPTPPVMPAAPTEFGGIEAPKPAPKKSSLPIIAGLIVLAGTVAGIAAFMASRPRQEQPKEKEVVKDPTPNTPYVPKEYPPKKKTNDSIKIDPDKKMDDPEVDPKPKKVDAEPKEIVREPAEMLPEPKEFVAKPKEVEPKPKEVKDAAFKETLIFRAHTETVLGLSIDRRGKHFVSTSSDKKVFYYTPAEGTNLQLHMTRSEGEAIAFSGKDDRYIVIADGGRTEVYDTNKTAVVVQQENPQFGIKSMAAARDGTFLLVGTSFGCVRRWALDEDKNPTLLEDFGEKADVTAIAMDAEVTVAAFGLSDGRISLWDLKNKRQLRRWAAHKGAINTLSFSPDGKLFISAGVDRTAAVWDTKTSARVQQFMGQGIFEASGWCPDNQRVLAAGIDQKIMMWNVVTGKQAEWGPATQEKVRSMAVDPLGRYVLAGQSSGIVQLFPLPRGMDVKE